jgi:hypothetical protein
MVTTAAGEFDFQVTGSGAVKAVPAPHGAINLIAYGTTSTSTISITQAQVRYHFASQLLPIQSFQIRSRQLGGLSATPAELDGRMTKLTNSMSNLDIGGLGPKAQVNINGGLGELSASSIVLGPNGYVSIAQGINAVPTTPTPGEAGPFALGSVNIGTMNLSGGRFSIGADSTLPITIQGNLTVSQDGRFAIGRDEDSSITVGGSVMLASGGQILVGRNLNDLTVDGNLIVGPTGSGIAVNGELNDLTVDGYFQGQGGTTSPSIIDLGVGLNLSGLTILSGVTGQGGLITANVRAGGSISGVAISYGTYQSTIQSNASMST